MKQTKHGSTFKRSFGLAVKSRRKELGLSQDELAWRAGVHRTYVTNVERGICNPSLVSISKIADALGSSASTLLVEAESEITPGRKASLDILLVEDNAIDADLTVETLKRSGLANSVLVARDGVEAMEYLTKLDADGRPNRPRLVLLDLNLPRMNGIEVLRRMKADKNLASIPVVVLTISRADHNITECQRLGANAYVVKPVSLQNLSEVTPQLDLVWLLQPKPLSVAA